MNLGSPGGSGSENEEGGKSAVELIKDAVKEAKENMNEISRAHLRMAPVIRFCDKILLKEEGEEERE